MSNEIARKIAPLDAETLISKAVENNVNVETMERLLAMRKDLKEEQAREAFYASLAEFQSKCPIIVKDKEVKDKSGKVRYRYAPLESIIRQVGPILKECGLSYTFKTLPAVDTSGVDVVCEASHVWGFSKESSVHIDIDQEAFMNQAQKSGSALTYAKRYAFCNAFGILTGEDDDDGQSVGGGLTMQDVHKRYTFLMKAVLENIESILLIKEGIESKDYSAAAEAWFELGNETKEALWMAPTKGGPFTTEEVKVIKSTEFRAAYYGEEQQ